MKHKLTKTGLVAVTTTCVLGALVQSAAADSYWCKMFPKFCSDETTPGGTQHAPDAPGAAGGAQAPSMSPAAPAPAAPAVDAYKPESAPATPPPATTPPPASPAP